MLLATAISPFRGELDGLAASTERLHERVSQLEASWSNSQMEHDELKQICRGMKHDVEDARLRSGEVQTELKMLDDRCMQALGTVQDGSTAQQAQLDGLKKAQQQLVVRLHATEAELGDKASSSTVEAAQRQLSTL